MDAKELVQFGLKRLHVALFLVSTFVASGTLAFALSSGVLFEKTAVFAASTDALPVDGVVLRMAEDETSELFLDLNELPTDTGLLDIGDRIVLEGLGADLSGAQYVFRSQTFGGEGEFSCGIAGDDFACEVQAGSVQAGEGSLLLIGTDPNTMAYDHVNVRVTDASALHRTVAFGESGGVEVAVKELFFETRFVRDAERGLVIDTETQLAWAATEDIARIWGIEAHVDAAMLEVDLQEAPLPWPSGTFLRMADLPGVYQVIDRNHVQAIATREVDQTVHEVTTDIFDLYRLVRKADILPAEPSVEQLETWLTP